MNPARSGKMKFEEIETGDLIFVHGRGLIPALISLGTGGDITHVAIAISDYLLTETHFFTDAYIRPIFEIDEEVIVKRIRGGFSKGQRKDFFEQALKSHNRPYDRWQILGIIYQTLFGGENKFNNPKNYICNEQADILYSRYGIDLLEGIPLGDGNPWMMFNSPELETVIE